MRNKFEKLFDALYEVYGHDNQTFRLTQVAYVAMGIRDVRLHDDTCNFIVHGDFKDDTLEQLLVDQANEYDRAYREEFER